MTIREFFGELVLALERAEAESRRDLTLAWQTARLMRGDKLPRLDVLLASIGRRQKQTPQQHAVVVDLLSQMYGGKLRRATQRKKRKA